MKALVQSRGFCCSTLDFTFRQLHPHRARQWRCRIDAVSTAWRGQGDCFGEWG